MAFRVPTLNILCNIGTPPIPNVPGIPAFPSRLRDVPCQLSQGRRSRSFSTGGTTTPGVPVQTCQLAVAKLTDIRGPQDTVSFDMVEVPVGTGRWYTVYFVDDVGRGFPNEHRVAGIIALARQWTAPYL